MITYTGRALVPTNFNVPAPLDLAVQLGRLPRFGGATRVWPWTVLHHLLAGVVYMQKRAKETRLDYRGHEYLAWLLHEADEVVTGDIPTTWKSLEQKNMVKPLQRRTAEVYGGTETAVGLDSLVHALDMHMLVAEMHEVAPLKCLEFSGCDLIAHSIDPAHLRLAREAVCETRDAYFSPGHTGLATCPGTGDFLAHLKFYGANLHYFSKLDGGTA